MKRVAYATILSFHVLVLHAGENSVIDSLNDDMEQAAQIATVNNQNIDYQPFILSVWEQSNLMRFGARTIYDALLLIPGVEMTGDTMNNRTAIMRGSNPFAYGQTKLLIDGVVVNDQSFDSYNAYLDFPVELIQRIEIVRGSGSFIEGVNGYSGTINIITMPHNNAGHQGSAFASVGNNAFRQIGLWNTYDTKNGKLSLDAFYKSDDSSSPIPVTDALGYTGYAPLNSRYFGAGFSYIGNDFYVQGRINDYKHGSAFGIQNALPDAGGEQYTPSWNVEVGQQYRLSSDLLLKMKAGIFEDSWKYNAMTLPPCDSALTCPYGPLTFPLGFWADLEYKNRRIYGEVSTTYTGISDHLIKAGYSLRHEKLIDSTRISTEIIDGGTAIVDYSNTFPLLDVASANRYVNELYLSDTINLTDQVALAISGSAEIVTNMPFHTHTRGALVYQLDRHHIFKAMISHSCRLPSWQEMYTINNSVKIGNPDLNPEHVTSYEAQYLYKPDMDSTVGLNLFYLQNKGQITASTPDHTFQNIADRNILGFESEFRGHIGDNGLIALSYSYISGENIKGDEKTDFLPYSSSHILKGAFSYPVTNEINAGIVGRYESAKKRSPYDPRSDVMDPFSNVDLILGWENGEGLYVQGSVKNIENNIFRYPAPPFTYPDDYPVEGRTWYIRAGWKY